MGNPGVQRSPGSPTLSSDYLHHSSTIRFALRVIFQMLYAVQLFEIAGTNEFIPCYVEDSVRPLRYDVLLGNIVVWTTMPNIS